MSDEHEIKRGDAHGRRVPPPDDMSGKVVDFPGVRRGEQQATPSAPDPLPFMDAAAIYSPLPPIDWLCRQLGMANGRPVLISGYGGIGKTFAAQQLALAVAAALGKMWGCVPIEGSGPVLHIDYEQTTWITRWRYQRLARGLGIDPATLEGKLWLVSLPSLYLTDPRAEAELTRVATGKRLVIIDNLRAACPGVDENSSTIRQYLDMLTRVGQATGAIFMVVVHEGKSDPQNPRAASQRVRGSSAITDAAGAVISFSKSDTFIKVEQTRSNLGAPSEPVLIELVDTGAVDAVTGKSEGIRIEWVPVEQAAQAAHKPNAAAVRAKEAVLTTLRTQGPLGRNAIVQRTAGRDSAIKEAIKALLAAGTITCEVGAGRSQIYRLASTPQVGAAGGGPS